MALAPQAFLAGLLDAGVGLATGVPCSWLAPLTSTAAAGPDLPYVAAASEGEAVGIAAGAWLGGRLGLVTLQNSGLGNAVNPLTSLAATYDLPLLLLVSHRARDGQDAPQHRLMGAITEPLLALLEIPALVLPGETAAARDVLQRTVDSALERRRPAALVVPQGSFVVASVAEALPPRRTSRCAPQGPSHDAVPGPRLAALSALTSALRDDDLVVSTTGMTSRELFHAGDRAGTFYMAGSMGCAPALGLGLALAAPRRRVIVVDGDGALLMKAGVLATIGQQAPPNLLHLLLDNGCYESTGGQPSAAAVVDFAALAAACGYATSQRLADAGDLSDLVAGFRPGQGPRFASLAIAGGHLAGVSRVGRTPRAIVDAFREVARGPARLA